jgi:predicted amidophosphoribosyltransferase
MTDEKKNVTCPDCGADLPREEVADGRCPKCEYNIQAHVDAARRADVLKREEEKRRKENPTPAEKPRKKLYGLV